MLHGRDTAISFSVQMDGLLPRSGSDSEVHIWNIDSGTLKTISTSLYERYYGVNAVFAPDNRILVTTGGGGFGTIQFWDVVSGEQKMSIQGMPNGIDRIIFSPDGRTFATFDGFGTILLWDYRSIINPNRHLADVNGDGTVDITDLVFVARNFGQIGLNAADVNGDAIVDIADLLIVANAMDEVAIAPIATSRNVYNTLSKYRSSELDKTSTSA